MCTHIGADYSAICKPILFIFGTLIGLYAVADLGFGQGGPNWSGEPNFEMGRILYRVIAC